MTATNGHRAAIVSSDIDKLRQLLSSTTAAVLVPSDQGYDKSIQRWSRAAEKPAAVVIIPSVAEEVGIAVKYANDHGIDVAVKGGGRSTAGASSKDGGMLIDLSRMRNVDVDVGTQRLHIQGGALWGDVDEAAWEHGLATVGGTVADTGVGGFTLGQRSCWFG
jgi:FAD/FMN-containing dehydrogenase